MTKKAIEMLSKNTEKGFFLMVEGGRIDHAHHDSWANTALDETISLDLAVETAFNMTNPAETLIIVTADHGHTMSFAGKNLLIKGLLHRLAHNCTFFCQTARVMEILTFSKHLKQS